MECAQQYLLYEQTHAHTRFNRTSRPLEISYSGFRRAWGVRQRWRPAVAAFKKRMQITHSYMLVQTLYCRILLENLCFTTINYVNKYFTIRVFFAVVGTFFHYFSKMCSIVLYRGDRFCKYTNGINLFEMFYNVIDELCWTEHSMKIDKVQNYSSKKTAFASIDCRKYRTGRVFRNSYINALQQLWTSTG